VAEQRQLDSAFGAWLPADVAMALTPAGPPGDSVSTVPAASSSAAPTSGFPSIVVDI
jgi:hypothetical protein